MTTPTSPTSPPTMQPLIPSKVTKSGNTRISRKPMIIVVSCVVVIVLVFLFTDAFKPKANAQSANEQQFSNTGHGDDEAEILSLAPKAGLIGQSSSDLPQEDKLIPMTATGQNTPANTTPSPYEQMQYQMWQRQQQEALQAEQERQEQIEHAHESKTTVFASSETPHIQTENGVGLIPGMGQAGTPLRARASYQNQASSNYLLSTRVQALSPNEIKAGTVIPATLIAGINSQLPGEIIAQVTSNVFDTATGDLLLIPQGARLVGRYDNQVVLGQKRVLISWNRIIYPDASSLDIEGMAGHDEAGYTGFKDKVNNHTWSVFSRALLMSAITAGAQLSQPRARSGDYSYSSQQILAASLGMNLNQLSMLTLQSRMNMSPTLRIRPGYRFNVMVSKDIILPPWESSTTSEEQQYTVSR